jgi:hypothetical protein
MSNDIAAIVAGVQQKVPEVQVLQMHKTHDANDDGIWWFRLPGVREDIQIESSSYNCPFLVEHDSMKSSADAITCRTVEETITVVANYLHTRRRQTST